MPSPTILALDLGTRTGFALLLDGRVQSGVNEFRAGRHEGAGMQFIRFRGWLQSVHTASPLTALYYEEVRRHLGTDAAHVYGAFWGTLAAWCRERDIPFAGVPVGTIKKHATGKGNANKEGMVAAARYRLEYQGDSADEADALWLLDYATNHFGSAWELLQGPSILRGER